MMMKRLLPLFCLFAFCAPVCFGGLDEYKETEDGKLTGEWVNGEWVNVEYVDSVELESGEELIVQGGGADLIEAKSDSYLWVQYTSTPLSDDTGIYDIVLYDESDLLYEGGITNSITVRDDATAILKSGTINHLTIFHGPEDSCYVTIVCQEGYTKTNSGISGLWADGTSFNIGFTDVGPYVTADYVYVIPEPATLALLGFGALVLQRKKRH
jgi:hypothetical protein